MKQLELKLKKRFLIVEIEDKQHLENVISCHNTGIRFMSDKEEPTKLICKGDELNEEISEELIHQSIHTGLFAHYVNDIPVNTYCYKSALESFISAIEAKGYYWGKNPKPHPAEIEPTSRNHYDKLEDEWQEAESKTFNPEKTLIFEIL